MEKNCPRCHHSFTCKSDVSQCWCQEVALSPEQQGYVDRNFEGCLCAPCLSEVQAEVRPVTIRDLSNFLLDYSSILMGAGVHTSRIERNATRIAGSFGYQVEMTLFQRHITMNILHAQDDTIRRTSVKTVDNGPFNFEIISNLSALSWRAHDEHLTLYELEQKFKSIIAQPRLSRWWVLLLVPLANASFCRLFGGDWIAMGLVFSSASVGVFVRQEMTARQVNHLAIVTSCAFIASMIAATGSWFSLGTTPQIALGTSVLFLIPGVPLINSIIDLLEGHVLIGISRAVNAMILITCIALGLSATLLLLGKNAIL